MTQSTAAATDVGEFWTDLDGGTFEHMLSVALSQTAAAVVDHEKKGKVTITLRLGVQTGAQKPALVLRIAAKEKHDEAMAEELAGLVTEAVGDGTPCLIGVYAAGS